MRIEDNVEKGIAMFEEAVSNGATLVIFPELWTCGYLLDAKEFDEAIQHTETIVSRFSDLAKQKGVMLILPMPQKIEDKRYIGLYVIETDGRIIANYQKSFLWGREQKYFEPGKREYKVLDTTIGKLGVLICYDIEFPEPARLLAVNGAELIIVPSVWSIPAQSRWNIQLPARALDNTVYIAGVNNCQEGTCGQSMIIDPTGSIMQKASVEKEEVIISDVDFSKISEIREKIPYLKEFDYNLLPGGRKG